MDKEENTNKAKEEEKENDTVLDVKQKYIMGSSNKSKEKADIEKDQEAKLRAKFPDMKPGKSAFLQKRMSKGRVYFDSGEYNMSKTKKDTRNSQKVISNTPTFIPRDESEEHDEHSDENAEHDRSTEYGEKDNPLPEPQETANQAIPTPELIFLRRATLHMPMSTSEVEHASIPDLSRRRYTAAPKGLDPPEVDSSQLLSLIETENVPLAQQLSKRRSTLQVPSKLAM